MNYTKLTSNDFIVETELEKFCKIKLEYFDYKGNYFGEGEFLTKKLFMFQIYDEVMLLKRNSALPNLKGDEEVTIYIDGSNHPNGFPMLCCLKNTNSDCNKSPIVDTYLKNQEDEYKVKLEYFKHSGKYYTDDELLINESNSNKILEDIYRLKNENKLPGVVNSNEFIVYVDTSDYNGGFKKIIF